MTQFSDLVQSKNSHGGSVIVPILVLAIIVVLGLMWQAGVFSGSSTAPTPGPESAASPAPGTAATPASGHSEGSVRAVTKEPQLVTTPLEPLEQKPTGKEPEGITTLANNLLAAHPVDMTPCRADTDTTSALECAAGIQSSALESIFEDYEARRQAGDLVANQRGGEVLKLVVAELNAKLQAFEDAAK